ncbi:MAG: cell division protein DedD, partial [Treponema sp.]|nr:cell division protein DedD [Treponema sp.]
MSEEKYVRPTWDEYFMEVARTIAKRATCDRG